MASLPTFLHAVSPCCWTMVGLYTSMYRWYPCGLCLTPQPHFCSDWNCTSHSLTASIYYAYNPIIHLARKCPLVYSLLPHLIYGPNVSGIIFTHMHTLISYKQPFFPAPIFFSSVMQWSTWMALAPVHGQCGPIPNSGVGKVMHLAGPLLICTLGKWRWMALIWCCTSSPITFSCTLSSFNHPYLLQ